MTDLKDIKHPIINSYVDEFMRLYELSNDSLKDKHLIFEKYINYLILEIYGNDQNAIYDDMDTGTAVGIDGLAIFVSDTIVHSVEDVESILEEVKKIDVSFLFSQSKTSNKFDRHDVINFFQSIRRFFNLNKCEIPELENFWEITKYIFSKSSRFKKPAELSMIYATLSTTGIDENDSHMKAAIDMGIKDLKNLNLFNEKIQAPQFIGVKQIMTLNDKINSELEISINMAKPPIPYPKDPDGKIQSAYYGLIKIDEFTKLLTDTIDGKKILRKGIFDNNIRYYLGSDEKIDVNKKMKNQLLGKHSFLFGMLNNGVTVICDEVRLSSEDLTLTNYQIVNGCQTSHVIFEVDNETEVNISEVYLPIRFIATDNEDAKNAIIKANNSQTQLKAEQLVALSSVQKAIEQFYDNNRVNNKFDLYYERRTAQYRDENIQKTKIVTIPYQIKSTSALFLDLPHAVSGQYGKVEKSTRGKLFEEDHLGYLNTYYVSGLAWYRVERFVVNNEDGKKYKRARWHIVMLIKYLCCLVDEENPEIGKKSENNSKKIEKILLDENKTNDLLKSIVGIIEECFNNDERVLSDRKLFEKKDTTLKLIDFAKKYVKERGIFV